MKTLKDFCIVALDISLRIVSATIYFSVMTAVLWIPAAVIMVL